MKFKKIPSLSILKTKKAIALTILILAVAGFFGWQQINSPSKQPQYQVAAAEKGTLVKSISASGQITTANNVTITIQASGVVKDVFVKNGDTVTAGQKLAVVTLDQASQQKQAAAYANYLSAQNTLAAAQAKINSLQSALFKANQAFINDKGVFNPSDTQKADPRYIEENAEWLQAEADYKNQTAVIAADAAAVTSASLALSQTSSTITAPVAGVVKGLTITRGAIITVTSQASSTTSTSQVLGSIYQQGPIQVQVNISEIDSVYVSEGQKVTMTLDAFPDKTFTGKVVSVNTNGVTSSGVTTYPAVISFETGTDQIHPNMGVSAKIITGIKNDVVLIPSAAVQTGNGQSIVRVMRNGNPVSVPVEVGDSNDTQTEITSGINQGDGVVTAVVNSQRSSAPATSSPFSSGFGPGALRPGGSGGGNQRR